MSSKKFYGRFDKTTNQVLADDLASRLSDEDKWWYGYHTSPKTRWDLVYGNLQIEEWRKQRTDCRPRWRRILLGKYLP